VPRELAPARCVGAAPAVRRVHLVLVAGRDGDVGVRAQRAARPELERRPVRRLGLAASAGASGAVRPHVDGARPRCRALSHPTKGSTRERKEQMRV
jgi:hypothetical protein